MGTTFFRLQFIAIEVLENLTHFESVYVESVEYIVWFQLVEA